MAANNPRLLNMALIGAASGSNNRWPQSKPTAQRLAAYTAFATAVDQLIPTITTGPAMNQIFLMLGLASGAAAGRDIVDVNPSDYSDLAKSLVDLWNQIYPTMTEIPGLIAMGHVHDSGAGPVLQKSFNIASVTDNVAVGDGAYIVNFTRPIELDHTTFWATFDGTDPTKAGVVFVQGGSGAVLNLIRFNVFTNSIERGDFNFGVEGMP